MAAFPGGALPFPEPFMHVFEAQGWTKRWRRRFDSSVYRNRDAYLVLDWLIDHAWPWPTDVVAGGEPLRLERGQLFATYDGIAAGALFETPKPVRSAFLVLKGKSIDWTPWPRRRPRGMVVTVLNYDQYQGNSSPLHGEDGPGEADSAPKSGQANPLADSQADSENAGRLIDGETALSRNGERDSGDDAGAGKTGGAGQANPQANGQAYKDQEVIKNINPPYPPLKKGGVLDTNFSGLGLTPESNAAGMLGSEEDRYRMAAAIWREEWEAAGQTWFADPKAEADLRELGAKLTRTLVMGAWQLRMGMRKLAGEKVTPRCRNWRIRNLWLRPNDYFPPPPVVREPRRLKRWRLVCDVCGNIERTDWLPANAPPPAEQDCSATALEKWVDERGRDCRRVVGAGCQGRMYPEIDEEKTV